MNERIDKLMIQAGARFEFLHGVHYDDFQYRKFAELIVRECGKVYIQNQQDGVMTLTQDLLQHFGVEE